MKMSMISVVFWPIEFDLAAGDKEVINIHYRLVWPKDQQIG